MATQPSRNQREGMFTKEGFNIKPLELKKFLDGYIIGQEAAKRAIAVALCSHYNRLRHEQTFRSVVKRGDEGENAKGNLLLIGPTGAGKTYMVHLATRYVGVPTVFADATEFTETGYVGGDVADLPRKLVNRAGNDVSLAECGVIYLDEIDKLARSSSSVERDVSGGCVQEELLKLIEGTTVDLQKPYGRQITSRDGIIDTKNILFIMSGAFDGLTEIIKNQRRGGAGFRNETERSTDSNGDELANVTIEDLVKYGLDKQFIGRIQRMAALHQLSEKELYAILKLPTCAAVAARKKEFMSYDINLEFTDSALEVLAAQAAQIGSGGRALNGVIAKVLEGFSLYLPSTNVRELRVTKDVVENPQAALEKMLATYPLQVGNKPKKSASGSRQRRNKRNAHIPDYLQYMLALQRLGLAEEYMEAAVAYGRERKMRPEAIPSCIAAWHAKIERYERDLKKQYEKAIILEPKAQSQLIVEAFQRKTDIESLLYARVGRHFENAGADKIKSMPVERLELNNEFFFDPIGYLGRMGNIRQ